MVQFFFCTGLVALVHLCMRHILISEIEEGRYRLVLDALRDDIYLGCSMMFRHCGLSKYIMQMRCLLLKGLCYVSLSRFLSNVL